MFESLWSQLPEIARHLVDESWADIDASQEHEPNWHQWGVLTHTERVWQAMQHEITLYCLAWGLPVVQQLRGEEINGRSKWQLGRSKWQLGHSKWQLGRSKWQLGRSKWQLLLVACILHDLGKWADRSASDDGSYSFRGHEAVSEQLIRSDPVVRQHLFHAGLSESQLDYIARVAGLHYELGKVRRLGYRNGRFNQTFLHSPLCQQKIRTILQQQHSYAREIGLIFLADSLAKVEFRPGLQSEDEIKAQVKQMGLSPKLLRAAVQIPTNIALSRHYLATGQNFFGEK